MLKKLTQEELRDIYENNIYPIVILSKNREVKNLNKRALNLLGYSEKEAMGKNVKTFYKSEEEYKEVGKYYSKDLREKEVKKEIKLISKDGEEIWVEVTGKKIGDSYRWFLKDINERKILELDIKTKRQELERIKERVEFLNNEKRDFMNNLSHELRTPLNAIIGFSEMLKDNENDISKIEKLETIRESGLKLLTLTNKIVNNITIDINERSKKKIDIKRIINSFYDIYSTKLGNEGKILLNIDKKIPEVLIGDKAKVEHIILNIIKKAIKSLENGDIILDVSYNKNLEVKTTIVSSEGYLLKPIRYDMVKKLLSNMGGEFKLVKKKNKMEICVNIPLKKGSDKIKDIKILVYGVEKLTKKILKRIFQKNKIDYKIINNLKDIDIVSKEYDIMLCFLNSQKRDEFRSKILNLKTYKILIGDKSDISKKGSCFDDTIVLPINKNKLLDKIINIDLDSQKENEKYNIGNIKKGDLEVIIKKIKGVCRFFSKKKAISLGKELKIKSPNMEKLGDEIINAGKSYNVKKLEKIAEKLGCCKNRF